MSDKINKTVRSKSDIKVELHQDNKIKYAILYDYNTKAKRIGNIISKGSKMDSSMSDDEVISETLKRFAISSDSINLRNNPTKIQDFYVIEQDPWSDTVPIKRHYGFTPYYLNNGCNIEIKWVDSEFINQGSYNDDASSYVSKYVSIYFPKGFTENNGKGYMTEKQGKFYYSDDPKGQQQIYGGLMKDVDIVSGIISYYKNSVASLHGDNNYDLTLCTPDTQYCSIIPYKSPIKSPENTLSQTLNSSPNVGNTQSSSQIKFPIKIVGLPEVIQIKALQNLPDFTVYIGNVPVNNDTFDDLPELDAEYQESTYAGEEETGLTFDEWQSQFSATRQEDCSQEIPYNGQPVNVRRSSSFEALINLAGQCARSLGKNSRVNSTNMMKPYTKGIHGLCPQGTQAVLYALTGIKSLGQFAGNADWFSFKNPTNPPGGENKGNFAKTGYFNDKVRITRKDGSWKGTYLTTPSMWQIGDVIAMGYNERSYGHIQVWTGYYWMSDFKQGAIQQNGIDPFSVALWRLNQKGLNAIKQLK